jgi:hypothetical protein
MTDKFGAQGNDILVDLKFMIDGTDFDDDRACLERAAAEITRLRSRIAELEMQKDGAYEERNKVVAALAKCFPCGVAKTAIEGWDADWHGCVYIDLPTGQASWHYHDSQSYLFDGFPPYQSEWDGHDTPEKYKRLAGLGFVYSRKQTT